MRKLIASALLTGAALFAQPALALTPADVACNISNIGLSVGSCAGFYEGNLSSSANSGEQTLGLAALGFTFPNAFTNAIEKVSGSPAVTATAVTFGTTMYGLTYIGIHFGNIPNPAGKGKPLANNITAFYTFDAGTSGLNSLSLAFNSGSNATIYATGTAIVTPPVPEPATWAMMIGGFGLAGAAMRRRVAKLSFA